MAAATIRNGRVLVARRSALQRNPLLWELPGGKVEAGETDPQALARELAEELDVEVVAERWLAEAEHAYDWGSICLVAWRCRLVAGEPRALEHAELRWVAPAEIFELDFAPADRPLLQAVVAELTADR